MTFAAHLLRAAVGLLPVVCFLAALVALDSYKLVRLKDVLALIALGVVAAGLSYALSLLFILHFGFAFGNYSRYVAPWIEESLKAAVIVSLIRQHRIGFLVDAAIFGFAVGTGFAVIENLYYLRTLHDAHIVIWIVRGFGTAVMHGGVTAILAVGVLALTERRGATNAGAVLPPLVIAVVLHSAFNQFVLPPIYQTLLVMTLLPPLLWLLFERSQRGLETWLRSGFDADSELIELLNSGAFSESPVGRYLNELKARFRGMAVADMLCYLRLHVELALRAKGLLMLRENGIEMPVDEATRSKFEEMHYLERSVGATALLALKPFLHLSRKDLWQLYMLSGTKQAGTRGTA
jgi:RsiW-degrading membrane proteinase PrsW (M82 family)